MATNTTGISHASIDGGPAVVAELHIDTESIDVPSLHDVQPDRRWTYTDPLGHFHAWSDDKQDELPTLTAKRQHIDCGDPDCVCGGEGYHVTVYDCRICGAPVEPETIDRGPTQRSIAGPRSWRISVAARVAYNQEVSIRISHGDSELFGVATPTGGMKRDNDRVITELFGISPLGTRKRTD